MVSRSADDLERARERMVERLVSAGRIDRASTERAMRAVPRHAFVPEDTREQAYEDRPLPIGEGQTISAPHMVAMMVDLLDLEPGERVLEVGTGCGYHAAVTAEVVGPEALFTVEYHADLAESARRRFEQLGYGDISVRVGDGHDGWPEHAPYDAGYLTCAAASIPDRVVDQVAPGGRVLAPIGSVRQELVLARIGSAGIADRSTYGGVRFVDMKGG